ncbi:MAG: CoB--CoM heterodisulfide reductase iron-sulfur subunit B family protein [Chloroflexota bacterium]|nr:CoB--CoM heterodisulfide reductase iron-sulfur subunit B family protein [Chloroflexota bacterium]
MRYSFYPGCTLDATSAEYGRSVDAVCEALGIELVELEDWSCCGSSSAHALDHELSLSLPVRNIALAQPDGLDTVMPCPACYQRTLSADKRLREDETWRREMESLLEFTYNGHGRPRHLLDVLANDLPLDAITTRIKRPLQGLRPVSYYGCVLVRPPELTGWDDPEHPVLMDRLLVALGAEPVSWSYGVDCCGASLALNRGDVVKTLVGKLAAAADEAGANCIVTVCGMCHINLDTRQQGTQMPVFYLTELMGLAFDLPGREKWFRKHFVNPRPLLESLGLGG